MICYVDTSALLSILFGEDGAEGVRKAWTSADHRLSSILLAFESLIVLQRTYGAAEKRLGQSWLVEHERARSALLQEVHLLNVDTGVLGTVSMRRELSTCRTLDAIHLATAVELRDEGFGTEIAIATLDASMRRVARRLKFKILP